MPTLLENPPRHPAPSVPLTDLLHRRHRWERWRGVLFTSLVGLTVTFLALATVHFYGPTSASATIAVEVWVEGFLLTVLASLISWRFAPSSLLDTAQQMDRDLTSKNRLEATATLHQSTSPLAKAQREETSAYLNRQAKGARRADPLPWVFGIVVVLLLAQLTTLTVWVLPKLMPHPHPAAPVPPPPPPKEVPKATIVWQSPAPESKANPIEEVPTVAIAQSTSGLKNLSLEMSVNGVPKMSTPPSRQALRPGRKEHVEDLRLYG